VSWPLTNLDDLLDDIQPGFASGQNESDGVLQVRMNNVKPDGSWDWSKERRVPATLKQLDKYSLQSGDILFNTTNSPEQVGKSALFQGADEPVSFSNHFLRLRVKKSKLSESYLTRYFAFLWQRKVFENMVDTWVNQATVQRDSFLALKIPLPPLAEQKRIAAILDKADILRRKNQQAIQLADQFLRAVFLDLFGDPMTNPKGWERCKFESLIDMVTYGLTVRPEYLAEGVPLISAREIRSGQINFDGAPKISEKDFEKLSEKARPNFQDILFSKTGSIGHCAIVESNLKFAVTQNAARIVPNTEKCEPLFLLSLLRTNYFFDLANREAKGNAVKDLQLGVMKEFPVYAPPMDIQRKYAEIFKRIKNLSSMNFDAQLDGNELFNSISQRAFAGEL